MEERRETLWGGRFRKAPDARLMRLSRSDLSHVRLVPYDIAGSRAHARELNRTGILAAAELATILAALDKLEADVAAGRTQFGAGDEDIHTFLERELIQRLGTLGGKLRAGRSRNDQAANDLKLYLRAVAIDIASDLRALEDALITQAEAHAALPAPGFTHLQPAQPVTFGHHLLAHAQALARDLGRIADWRERASLSPLGSAALAGSALAKRPDLSALELGYSGACENSIDAVGARDHVAEFLFVAAMIAVDVSRLAEEVTIWSTRQFGWIDLDDAFSTGSSIMPQKKNPDIAELSRGRAARLIGDLAAMLGALKGLPLAYNRDLSEDKRAAFDAVDVLGQVLPAMAGLIATMRVRTERVAKDAGEGYTLATEIADFLARNGVPFSEAHEVAGAAVRLAEDKGVALGELSAGDLAKLDARLTADVMPMLDVGNAIASRDVFGGTAPGRVREQIGRLRDTLARLANRLPQQGAA
ncbi:MAG: argininosuccinate lyase [Rhodospirillales bacterium]|nr:argininosuccinate lyase [Rhodospirillales bacterium]